MNKEEMMQHMDDMMNLLQQIEPYRLKIIDYQKSFINNLMLLTGAIAGVVIPLLIGSQQDINKTLLIASLIGFVLVIIGGVVYQYRILETEYTMMKKLITSSQKYTQNAEEDIIQIQSMMNMFKDSSKELKFLKYGYHITVILFVISLALLILSII